LIEGERVKYRLYKYLFIGLLILLTSGKGYSQIDILWDGFLDRQLFFTPATVSPNNLGMFENVAPGLFDHPLQEAYMNPARLGRNIESRHYFYTDYRTLPSIERTVYRFPSQEDTGEYSFGVIGFPTPIRIIKSSGDEPHFTGAWIYRPQSTRNFVIGITYRQLHASDPYYDNYRRIQPGIGRYITQSDGPVVPLDREQYGRFRQTGHIPSIMASMRLSDVLTAGLRTSVSYYTSIGNLRDGRFIEEEIQGPGLDRKSALKQDDDEPILVKRVEHAYINRGVEQQYLHWEATAGIQLDLSDIRSLGVTAGILYGDVDQLFNVDHFISIQHGRRYQDEEWNYRRDNLSVSQTWDRHGYHYSGTVEYLSRAGDENQHRMQVFYRWGYTSLQIGSRGTGTSLTIFDNAHYYPATVGQTLSESETTSITGNELVGSITGYHHRIGINRRIQYGSRTALMIGVVLGRISESKRQDNHVDERVNFESRSWYDGDLNTHFSQTHRIFTRSTDDRVRLTSLLLPLVLRIQISERVLIEGGGLLRYNDITTTHVVDDRQYYNQTSSHQWEREENEDEALVAGLLSAGFQVLPGVTIRLSGVTETRITDNDFGMPMLDSLTLSERPETNGGTRFMISLEMGI